MEIPKFDKVAFLCSNPHILDPDYTEAYLAGTVASMLLGNTSLPVNHFMLKDAHDNYHKQLHSAA